MKRTTITTLVLGLLVSTAACSPSESGGDAGELRDIHVAFAAASPNVQQFFLYAIPQELGYYEEEGLRVQASQTGSGGSTAALQTLTSGSVDVANSVAPNTVAAVDKGAPVKAFARIQEQWTWHTVVAPGSDIQDFSDLAGKRVGVVSLASIAYPYARGALDISGVDPDSIEYLPVGTGVPAFTALRNGDVDALTYFTSGLITAEGGGFEFEYLENPEYFNDLPAATWVARTRDLDEDPDKYAAFARAQYKGVVFALTNPEAAVTIGYKHYPDLLPSPDNYDEQFAIDLAALQAEAAEQVRNPDDPSQWVDWGGVTAVQWDNAQDFAILSGDINEPIPVDDFWTDALLDAINSDLNMEAVIEDAENYDE